MTSTFSRACQVRRNLVSLIALVAAGAGGWPGTAGARDAVTPAPEAEEGTIIVTGIRSSLEQAADIKRTATQVVDSIVATDIGKLPDPTVAAALQRVPGIQVVNDRNNELGGVRIRGLTDILTTVNGREVMTTTGRDFDLQDMPAEALNRVDVFKSQTVDQIEGGVAGSIDLRLNRPFSLDDRVFVLTARGNYAQNADAVNPQIGALASVRTDTPLGEIGLLVNATWSTAETIRGASNMTERRYSGRPPLNQPGYLIPQVIQNMPDVGEVDRGQINAALQWQATPELEAYVEGFYTYFGATTGFAGFNAQPFTDRTRLAEVTADDYCFDARVNAAGTNPTIVSNADGTRTLQPFTVERVCNITSARFDNIVINQNNNSEDRTQANRLIAGGLKFATDRATATLDVAWQTSEEVNETFNAEVGQRVPSVFIETDVDNGPAMTIDAAIPLSATNLSLRNSINQNYTRGDGELFQARLDGGYEFDSVLTKLRAGIRFARREARFQSVQQTNTVQSIGFGNIGTATEANARLVSTLPLSADFIGVIGEAPRLNGGADFLGADSAYLRSERGRNELRALFNLPLQAPAYDPTREFDAEETTYAGYLEGTYEIPLGELTLDGVFGTRLVRTDRTISGFERAGTIFNQVEATTSDTDVLPAFTARLQFPAGFQTRFTYSRAIRRPDFATLSPTESLTLVGNVFLLNSGSRGNPDLRPQKSDSFDVTAEYYFDSGYVAVTGYYRSIKDRVVTAATQEAIAGLNYLISSPRNVGSADLKGVELSAQYFFDFLPGILSGFGAQGAFTLADTEIKGDDSLAGYALVGVSKYNYTAGLLYDKAGLSGRLIWTHRSGYIDSDSTGGIQLRPFDPARVNEAYVPVLLANTRAAGRLDFSVGYDVSDNLRLDVGGTNILRNRTSIYRGDRAINFSLLEDETVYALGARVRF
ncbi:TonB-dependent receptor [Croceibacterium mercuriale]|uniref:TonB-dependent receptor n=1 Tax=Croceibacterium mercuriale TaxID=1572751 RepID=UPI00068AA498|nr:TonB-dependent receptor [Croceibacterium mercuriale]